MDIRNVKFDVFGGLTAGVVALPLALAFGVQSGLGAVAGLYGAIVLGFLAAVLGGTPTQISGPTGPMTVITATVVTVAVAEFGSLSSAYGLILLIFFAAGLLQVLFGLLRFGEYVKYIPYPVVSGFMSGIGVIIILLQTYPLLGHRSPKTIIDIVTNIDEPLEAINIQACSLAVATIAIIYLFPKVTRAIPSSLVALLVVSVFAVFAGFNVPVIGDIPTSLPTLQWEAFRQIDWSQYTFILLPAATLAALGTLDSLLTSIVADNITKTRHDSNRELLGQGVGNMAVALVGGIPGAGATMRTVVNVNAGGRTRLSGAIHALLLLTILLGLGQYAGKIPLSVLAGILITVGIDIIDYRGIKHLIHVPRADAIVMVVVLLLTVFVNLLQAVAVGMVLATLLFMKKMADLAEQNTIIAPINELGGVDLPKDDRLSEQIYVKRLAGPLFFGFAAQFQALVQNIPQVKIVIICMENVPYIDQSGLYAIEEAVLYLERRGVTVLLTDVPAQVKDTLKVINIIPNLVPKKHIFADFETCVQWLRQTHALETDEG